MGSHNEDCTSSSPWAKPEIAVESERIRITGTDSVLLPAICYTGKSIKVPNV